MFGTTRRPFLVSLGGAITIAILFSPVMLIRMGLDYGGITLLKVIIPILLATVIAYYWTRNSTMQLTFARAALRGAVVMFVLMIILTIGGAFKSPAITVALSKIIRPPMPVKVDWPRGWDVTTVKFDEKWGSTVSGVLRTDDRSSNVFIFCVHSSQHAAVSMTLDESLSDFVNDILKSSRKKQSGDIYLGNPMDASLGTYQGRRIDIMAKDPSTFFHGEVIAADSPACRIMLGIVHGGGPYSEVNSDIESIKASVK